MKSIIWIYWGIMKILIIREAFKLRLSLRMTLNNENPFQTTAKTSSSSPYLEITILLYKYGLLYLPTYHKSLCPNFFLEKVWLEDTLPTYSLDICPKFVVFLFGTLSLDKTNINLRPLFGYRFCRVI